MKTATIERELDDHAGHYAWLRGEIKRLRLLKELEHAELSLMVAEGERLTTEKWDVARLVVMRRKVDLEMLRAAVDLTPYTQDVPVGRLLVTAVGP